MSGDYFALWSRSSVGGKPESFNAGDTIFAQGDPGDRMYIVRSGSVEVLVGGKVVEIIQANGIFGEMALVDGGVRSATARAKDACELAPIDHRLFLLMVDEAPYFALNVMKVMANRLRRNEAP
jgi:CRP/FNR family transcriptional regulator, cyclic AMP receptor protein